MKVPIWLRWSAVAMSAFLAGFYVAYASGYVKQSSERYMSSSKSRALTLSEAFQQSQSTSETQSKPAEPDAMFSSSKSAPVFTPSTSEAPPAEEPPPTWMYSSKSAPISPPPNTVVIPKPESKQFFSGSKSATIFSDQAPSPLPPSVDTGKSAPAAKGNYQGKGAP